MNFDHVECTVLGHYASAMINGDFSGLTDKEALELNNFQARIERGRPPGHWDGFDEEADNMGFTRDDVSGLRGDCYKVRYYFPAADVTPAQPSLPGVTP